MFRNINKMYSFLWKIEQQARCHVENQNMYSMVDERTKLQRTRSRQQHILFSANSRHHNSSSIAILSEPVFTLDALCLRPRQRSKSWEVHSPRIADAPESICTRHRREPGERSSKPSSPETSTQTHQLKSAADATLTVSDKALQIAKHNQQFCYKNTREVFDEIAQASSKWNSTPAVNA